MPMAHNAVSSHPFYRQFDRRFLRSIIDPTLGRLAHLKVGTPTSLVRHLLIRDGLLYYIVIVIGLVSSLPLGFYRSSDLLSQHLRLWLGGYSSTCNKLAASCLSTAPWLAKDQVIDIEFVGDITLDLCILYNPSRCHIPSIHPSTLMRLNILLNQDLKREPMENYP